MLFQTLALVAVANALVIEPFGATNEISPLPQSFIDSLYGDLVDTPDSQAYKSQLFASGKIQAHHHEAPVVDFGDMHISDFQSLMQEKQKYDRMESQRFAEKSHQAYLKYHTKSKLPHDDETEDLIYGRNLFGGILTFGGIDHFSCFDPNITRDIDVAIVGAPFDTGVSYRPGARFGPEGIRSGARRLGGPTPVRSNGQANTNLTKINPYNKSSHNLSIIDCGDVPLTPFDNRIALNQLYRGERAIHKHSSRNHHKTPKIITMGGDHTVTLMALRSAYEKYGKINVLHFDSHIDTWDPKVLGGGLTNYMNLNHGTFLHYAAEQGYLNSSGCYHLGIRAPYIDGDYDPKHDKDCGFKTLNARTIDQIGVQGLVDTVMSQVGKDAPVYITVDIDVLDPAFAPATGTMEVGGWSTRELLSVLDGLEGINLVGADVVEVSPPFDSSSEITSLAATQVIDTFLSLMIAREIFT